MWGEGPTFAEAGYLSYKLWISIPTCRVVGSSLLVIGTAPRNVGPDGDTPSLRVQGSSNLGPSLDFFLKQLWLPIL